VLLGFVCMLVAAGVIAALVFGGTRAVRRAGVPEPGRPRQRRCVRCGKPFDADGERCPNCGLDPRSSTAAELRDLEATARVVQSLLVSGGLDVAVCEQVYRCVEARQRLLINAGAAAARPVRGEAAAVVLRMEQWLGDEAGAGELTLEQRRDVLAGYRQLREEDLLALSPRVLRELARLLAAVGLASRALEVYRLLLAKYPGAAVGTEAALEAGRLAFEHGQWAPARRFLERALLGRPEVAAENPDAVAKLEHLRERAGHGEPAPQPADELIPMVLLVPDEAPSPAPPPPAPVVAPPPAEPVAPILLPTEPAVEAATPPAPIAAAPRRGLWEWLAVFMEERNVLWGEVVGGMLIVGCSIALVISLWQTLERFPLFPFLIFAAMTSGLLGAGFYTLSHWKLHSTSRGLLLIGLLLIPLNFLVLAGISRDLQAGLTEVVTAGAALLYFGWLTRSAGRILVQVPLGAAGAWADGLLVLPVLASALAHLLVPPLTAGEGAGPGRFAALGLLPTVCQAIAIAAVLARLAPQPPWTVPVLRGLFVLLGVCTFGTAAALGFLLYSCPDLPTARDGLALPAAVLGIPLLLAGALVHCRVTGRPAEPGAEPPPSGLWGTTGTGVALVGIAVLFGAFAMALPNPGQRWLVGGINVLALAATAWALRLPLLHVPAQVYLILLAQAGWRDSLGPPAAGPETPLMFAALLVIQSFAAEACAWLGRRRDAVYYAAGAGVSTALAALEALPLGWHHPATAATALGVGGTTWLAANRRWRRPLLSYAGLALLLGCTLFALHVALAALTVAQLGLWSALVHGSLCTLLGMIPARTWSPRLKRALVDPARVTAVVVTILAAAQIPAEVGGRPIPFGAASAWLALLWFALAYLQGSPMLFGAAQLALSVAVVSGVLAATQEGQWQPLELGNLHRCGLALAGLSLSWEGVRRLRPRTAGSLLGGGEAVDRLVLGGVILGQLLLAVAGCLPAVAGELFPGGRATTLLPAAWQPEVAAPAAWLLLGVPAVALLIAARPGNLLWPSRGLALLLLTAPVLATAYFDENRAGASALRWGLALAFFAAAALLWLRGGLERRLDDRLPAAPLRGLLVVGAVVPVVLLTCIVAALRLQGEATPGPLPGSVFAQMGGTVSLLAPLAILSAAWAGHGLRDRLPHDLLAGGLLGGASLVAGRLLQVHRPGVGVAPEHWVQALQLGAGFAWVWVMFWVVAGRRLDRPGSATGLLQSPLLLVPAYVGSALLGLILLTALAEIEHAPNVELPNLVAEAGSPGGWLVLALTAAGAGVLARGRGRPVSVHVLGLVGLAVALQLACTVERQVPGYGLPALMLALGALSLLWARGDSLREPSPVWSGVTGMLAILFAISGVFRNDHHFPAAAALVLTALAFALLAWKQRQEDWALRCAALLVLATSLVLWRWHFDDPWSDWWVVLVQADLAVLGATSLVWLLARHRIYRRTPSFADSWLLALQTGVGLAVNVMLLAAVLIALLGSPRQPFSFLAEVVTVPGWAALLLNLAATGWYVGLVAPRRVVHVAGTAGLLLGVMAAATVEAAWPADWLAYHTLTACWTGAALLLLATAWACHHGERVGPHFLGPERRAAAVQLLRTWLPEAPARAWVTGCGMAVVGAAVLAAWLDPALPLWASGNVLAISALLGVLAFWARQPLYSYASGLLFNVVGLLLHGAWARARMRAPGPFIPNGLLLGSFVSTQVLCFAAAGAAWSALERRLRQVAPSVSLRNGMLPYAHAALIAGVHLLALLVCLAVALQLVGLTAWGEGGVPGNPLWAPIAEPLAWCALAGLVLALLVALWDEAYTDSTRFQLYACGLVGLGLIVQTVPLTPDNGWYPVLLLAGYVLAVTALGRLYGTAAALHRWFPPPAEAPRWDWLFGYQAVLACFVAGLSVAIALAFAGTAQGLAGPAACLCAGATWLLLAGVWTRVLAPDLSWDPVLNFIRYRHFPRYVVLLLAVLVALEVTWAVGDADAAGWWLHRAAAAMAVLTAAAGLYRLGARRLPPGHAWREPARNLGAILMVAGYGAVLVLLGLELAWYDPSPDVRTTPLGWPLIVLDVLAVLGLVGLSLYAALTTAEDPLGVPAPNRGLYTYAALALFAGIFVHLRLNVPDILPPVLGRYWPLTVMTIAFAGVGASEFCQRRRWLVLAYPLRRTAVALALLPVLAYLAQPLAGLRAQLGQRVAGLQPLLRYLGPERLPGGPALHALCWLLLGLLHGWLARLRGSANQGLLAALFINFGVWVLLASRDDLTFLTHPQLWLIPPGLIILAAEFINRPRLGPWPSAALRSVGLLCIYLSSTFDMLLTGLGRSVVLPVALAVLSVLGVLLGILLRVRVVLLFGIAFLGVVVFAQIWHAAVDRQQTWVWWASGIVLGVTILALFAYFEKHRNEVLRMLEEIRQWD
jgi:hypothetical protein